MHVLPRKHGLLRYVFSGDFDRPGNALMDGRRLCPVRTSDGSGKPGQQRRNEKQKIQKQLSTMSDRST